MSKKYRFIGDIHGEYYLYNKIIDVPQPTIQVGDFGIGFIENTTNQLDKDSFIRGNHDNPHLMKNEANFIADGTYKDGMFFIGGAYSIDKAWRTVDVDWWEDEEIGYDEWDIIKEVYAKGKPDIVVTHDCPQFVSFRIYGVGSITTLTGTMLEELFTIHQPKLWIFGHHHLDYNDLVLGTSFKCINAKSYIDIDLDDYYK